MRIEQFILRIQDFPHHSHFWISQIYCSQIYSCPMYGSLYTMLFYMVKLIQMHFPCVTGTANMQSKASTHACRSIQVCVDALNCENIYTCRIQIHVDRIIVHRVVDRFCTFEVWATQWDQQSLFQEPSTQRLCKNLTWKIARVSIVISIFYLWKGNVSGQDNFRG